MTNLGRHAIGDKVLQQVTVVVTQNVLHHAQDVDGGIGEVLEPVLAPVHWNKRQKNTHPLNHSSQEIHDFWTPQKWQIERKRNRHS